MYAIHVDGLGYIKSFSQTHSTLTYTSDPAHARKFRTIAEADELIGIAVGHGLVERTNCYVDEITAPSAAP